MMVALRRWNTFQSRRPIPSSVFRQPKRSFEGLREEEVQLACSELGKFNHVNADNIYEAVGVSGKCCPAPRFPSPPQFLSKSLPEVSISFFHATILTGELRKRSLVLHFLYVMKLILLRLVDCLVFL
ncbi:uncharacterized protein LOC127799416 isoform X1 [Diospyros lotus]|uniref:uncharacterized protein LOC127799416 isoform X1 n=1 Tax=Diospyros lotus TaxID=55363 RepID=UPI00224EEAFE|nr:uncharacterized protein LOC127799416 isoform X1 [Diospyros lotus]